jgi:hypothetical protein
LTGTLTGNAGFFGRWAKRQPDRLLTIRIRRLKCRLRGRGGTGRRKGLKIPYRICYRLDFALLFGIKFCSIFLQKQSKTMGNDHFCKTFRDRKTS